MNELLEKAKSYRKLIKGKPSKEVTENEVGLAVAYLRGEITIRSYATAMDFQNPGQASHRVGAVIRYGLEKGLLDIKLK